MSFLEEIVVSTRHAIDGRKRKRPLREVRVGIPARPADRVFLQALQGPGISVIAEFKRSSPSAGTLREAPDLHEMVGAYARGGASALSILTEESCFSGSLADLHSARERTQLPLLRKDFVIDEYQVYEAAEAGADAILLIAAVLQDDDEMASLYGLTRELGLDVLFEVRDQKELRRALSLNADLIGINNRNLKTRPSRPRIFDVDIGRTSRLFDEIPPGVTVVAESGLETRRELDVLEDLGVHAALIGSALMCAPNPEAKCLELTGSHRSTKTSRPSDQPAFV